MQFNIYSPDGNEHVQGDEQTLDALCRAMAEKYGNVGRIETVEAVKPLSTFAEQVSDEQAKERIEAQHASLNASGVVSVDSAEQFYATGTRMAAEGYQAQFARQQQHERKLPAGEASEALASIVRAEKRRDIETTAAALARNIQTNGRLTALGFGLNEQAIRGVLGRCESPALGYVLGLRDRIRSNAVALGKVRTDDPRYAPIAADKERLAETIRHELAQAGHVELKLRVRESRQDCYAIVSPSYVPADAPEVLEGIVSDLPSDARATYAYDPASTDWELRASVWTPTPVAEQAVGEAFEGYVSFRSRDNGTGSFRGGGGILLIRCLNASTYEAASSVLRRRHTGAILVDVAKVIRYGTQAIDALCAAWGIARHERVEIPAGLKLQDVIPDFWTSLLTQRQYAFAGLLPGRTKEHASKLSDAYFSERRDPKNVVRSDFAQAWTRYIQEQPAAVRREAEAAAGAWLVGGRMPRLSESVSSTLS